MFSGFDSNAAIGGFPIQPLKSINSAKSSNRADLGLALGKIIDQVEALDGQARIKNQGTSNGQLAMGRTQIAGSALGNMQDIAGRMGELATQASNGMLTDADRDSINAEAQELNNQFQSIVSNTTFNGQNVLQGGSMDLQISSKMSINDADATGIAASIGAIDLSSQAGATAAMDAIANAQAMISDQQALVGGNQNMIAHEMIRSENEAAAFKDAGSSVEMSGILSMAVEMIQKSTGDAIAGKVHSAMNQQKKNLIDML